MQRAFCATCLLVNLNLFTISGSGLEKLPEFWVSLVFCHNSMQRKWSSNQEARRSFINWKINLKVGLKSTEFKGMDLQIQSADAGSKSYSSSFCGPQKFILQTVFDPRTASYTPLFYVFSNFTLDCVKQVLLCFVMPAALALACN